MGRTASAGGSAWLLDLSGELSPLDQIGRERVPADVLGTVKSGLARSSKLIREPTSFVSARQADNSFAEKPT
jgi:hypothetical protein